MRCRCNSSSILLYSEIYERLSWAINPDICLLEKWLTDACLIVSTYLVEENELKSVIFLIFFLCQHLSIKQKNLQSPGIHINVVIYLGTKKYIKYKKNTT